jgi:hypothetical protein
VYSGILQSKLQLCPLATAEKADALPGDHAQDDDGDATAGGGDAAHKAAANFIESQRLEKGTGSDEEASLCPLFMLYCCVVFVNIQRCVTRDLGGRRTV